MLIAFIVTGWICGDVFIYYRAKGKGKDPVIWVLLSVFLSPLVAIIALELQSSDEARQKDAETEERHKNSVSSLEFTDSLNTVTDLYEHQLIDDAEFQEKKRELFYGLAHKTLTDAPEVFLQKLIPFKEKGRLTKDDIDIIKQIIFN